MRVNLPQPGVSIIRAAPHGRHSIAHIRAAGDDPTQYVDIAIKVPERKYTAWPENIRVAFAPARTVKTGKPSFILTLKEDAR